MGVTDGNKLELNAGADPGVCVGKADGPKPGEVEGNRDGDVLEKGAEVVANGEGVVEVGLKRLGEELDAGANPVLLKSGVCVFGANKLEVVVFENRLEDDGLNACEGPKRLGCEVDVLKLTPKDCTAGIGPPTIT